MLAYQTSVCRWIINDTLREDAGAIEVYQEGIMGYWEGITGYWEGIMGY